MFSKDIINILFGGISGATASFITQPIDCIKTHVQSNNNNIKINDCVKNLWNKGSYRIFYNGCVPSIFGVLCEKSIVFSVYEKANKHLENNFLSGNLSGLVCSIITTPSERLKILMQKYKYNSLNTCFTSITNQYGYKTMFQGFQYCSIRESIGFGIYFSTYYHLKKMFISNSNTEYKSLKTFLMGGSSGIISWGFIFHVDNFKTIAQSSKEKMSFQQIYSVIKNSKNNYQALPIALTRSFCLHGIVFATYELLCRLK